MMLPLGTTEKLDVEAVRRRFPILSRGVYGLPLVYFDNAATSQKPQEVIDRLTSYYREENSNIHRGVHFLSQAATDAYEDARRKAARFINAPSDRTIVFTRGTTEAINLVAATYGRTHLRRGDVVLISAMEHHSNIVPWQLLCQQTGARLEIIPITPQGELDYEAFLGLLTERVRLVALCHVSNALGTINPVERIVRDAHAVGARVLLDGAQAVPHGRVDVRQIDCDFYAFSAHKMYGPTGFGVLYGREELLEEMPPYQGGGDMIESVTFEKTTYNEIPHRFEAGTPHISGGVGLAAAIDFMESVGVEEIARHEAMLLAYATERMAEIEGVRLVGTAANKASVLSFLLGDIHPYDAGTILDRLGIAVRTGHHCTQPLMRVLGVPGTVRASFACYNTTEEIDRLVEGVHKVRTMFS